MMQTVGVDELVAAAAKGDQSAWSVLVERYLPLVYPIVRRYRLSDKDAEDVSQTVWLRLVEQLGVIRDARALARWLAAATRHEVLAVLGMKRGGGGAPQPTGWSFGRQFDPEVLEGDQLTAELGGTLRAGLAQLGPESREMLLLLVADPPISDAEISRRLAIPIGSIGSAMSRSLAQLRATPAVQAAVSLGDGAHRVGGHR